MQILLTHGEVGQAVAAMIAERIALNEGETVQVYLTEDGATASILQEGDQPEPAEEASTQPAGERQPRKTRRTKAQIEADNKAEAERLVAAQTEAASGNDAVSTEQSAAETPAVEVEVAGETTQEPSDPGTEAQAEEPSQPEVAATVAVEEATAEPVEEAQAEEEPSTEAPKAAISLFANLRKPQNG